MSMLFLSIFIDVNTLSLIEKKLVNFLQHFFAKHLQIAELARGKLQDLPERLTFKDLLRI